MRSYEYINLYGNNRSWVLVVKRWMPINREDFEELWSTCPTKAPILKMGGREVEAPRRQRRFGGDNIDWSGQVNPPKAIPLSDEPLMAETAEMIGLHQGANVGALINFYDAARGHYVGAHTDDHRTLVAEEPIYSVSWGQTRRFRLTPQKNVVGGATRILSLEHGDIVVMGGTCQQTHKHEILQPIKCEKSAVGTFGTRRINATFRIFK